MELYDNIKKLRIERGLTQQQLADLTGYGDRSSIAKIEKGLVDISQSKLELFAKVLHVTAGDLLGNTPIYNVAAGEGILNEGYPSDEVRGILLESDQFFATVHGRSMEPTLTDGDLVVIAASNVVDSPDQIALVKINGDEATLKHVEIREDGIVLIGDNVADYKPHFYSKEQVQQLPVTIEGVVVKLIREL